MIHIFSVDSRFGFVGNYISDPKCEGWYCNICGSRHLHPTYIEILETLRDKGLLPDDFKYICCICWTVNKIFRNLKLDVSHIRAEELNNYYD